MKNRISLALAVLCALVLAPAACRAQAAKVVDIDANDRMNYDVTNIDAAEGQPITITLTNGGSMPKIAMAHNLVVLKPGVDPAAFAAAGIPFPTNNYIAPDRAASVLASTKLLGPGESETITFLPPGPGVYPYICTFPAHFQAGMRGVITVK
jgi:azurin